MHTPHMPLELEWSWLNFVVTWPKIFKPNDSTKKLSQMVLSQVIGNPPRSSQNLGPGKDKRKFRIAAI